MLQDTVRRVVGQRFAAPLVICNDEHRFVIAEQLREIAVTPFAIALEPVGRNTAAAAAVAALIITEQDPDALLLLLPADHVIRDGDAFHKRDRRRGECGCRRQSGDLRHHADPAGNRLRLYPPGRRADRPCAACSRSMPSSKSPEIETAQDMLAAGGHFWNGGMFLFSAAKLLAEMEKFEPAIVAACRDAISKGSRDLDFFRLDPEAFGRAPSISIDYAVMERTDAAVVVPATIGWTDVGAWSALWDIGAKDEDGNVTIGDVMTEDAKNCYIRSEGVLTAVVGLDDVVVVATDDAILVASRDKVQDIKQVVERLKKEGRPEAKIHSRVHRPWGFYQCLHEGERFQVKRLTVKPGATLSLQKHYHRAEHWVVVNGTALVTRDADQVLLRENESIYIPLGAVHRLENPGKVTLNLIEVQSGSYLGEDDIVRLTDTYGRA